MVAGFQVYRKNNGFSTGIRTWETDGTIKDTGEVTGSLDPAGGPVQLPGPIVGVASNVGNIIDDIGFMSDTCFCHLATPNAYSTSDMTIDLGGSTTQEATPPSPQHPYDKFSTVCPGTFTLTSSVPGLSLSGTTLTLDTSDPAHIGTHTASLQFAIDANPGVTVSSSF